MRLKSHRSWRMSTPVGLRRCRRQLPHRKRSQAGQSSIRTNRPPARSRDPNGQERLEDPPFDGYGNGLISTGLWSDGTVVFRPGGPGFVAADGSLGMKLGWRRAIDDASIEGRRLDETAPTFALKSRQDTETSAFRPPIYFRRPAVGKSPAASARRA